jgi:hypothetical protein
MLPARKAAPIAPHNWAWGEMITGIDKTFSIIFTTPIFFATPPVIIRGGLIPMRLAMDDIRMEIAS